MGERARPRRREMSNLRPPPAEGVELLDQGADFPEEAACTLGEGVDGILVGVMEEFAHEALDLAPVRVGSPASG